MSQLKRKPEPLDNYPYHLPDKPMPAASYVAYAEFLEWADEDTLAEWVDGRIEMSSPASRRHQEIAGLLYEVFSGFAHLFDLGVVLQSPFQMKLPGKRGSGREPDLLFIAKANLRRLEEGLVRGPADLVVEIVSPESEWRDRHDKFREYAAGGVPEYWLIDPEQHQAEFYRLDDRQHYQSQLPDQEGRYYSQTLAGFWLKPEWLWCNPLPRSTSVLKTVGGQTYREYLDRLLQSEEEL
ncbi:MAG TPA: Uma2 family endonuclease [Chloroflexia bacterium]|nr:Uma2 family endonuclease [Chloroflexia bacterium]